jgi:hypothetical protein
MLDLCDRVLVVGSGDCLRGGGVKGSKPLALISHVNE